MKKLAMMAIALMVSTMTFAGDSDALKAIMKVKNYAEAAQMVNSNLGQLADNAEKAKAYNHLVDLAMDKVSKEKGIVLDNYAAKGSGGKEKPVDQIGMADALTNAVYMAIECNKYDQLPNAKGKVSPKFAKNNAKRIWDERQVLTSIGNEESQKDNLDAALRYWGAYTDASIDPLFAEQDHKADAEIAGQVAYYAGKFAFNAKEYDRANRYLGAAMQDPEMKADALNFKLYAMRSNLKNQEDSLKCIEEFKKLYEQEPSNEVVLDGLYQLYEKDKTAQKQLLENHLAKYPDSFTAMAEMGVMAFGEQNLEQGAEWFRKALKVQPDNAIVQTYLGQCLNNLANNTDDQAKRKAYYEEAIQAFDKAKELDPQKTLINWGYNRYTAYYALYGENDPRTKDAEYDK